MTWILKRIFIFLSIFLITSTGEAQELFRFKITQYICPRAMNGPLGIELIYSYFFDGQPISSVNFSTNPLKILQISSNGTVIDTTVFLINENRTLTLINNEYAILVLGNPAIRNYLLANGLTQVDAQSTSIMFIEVNFTFNGNDYLEIQFDGAGNGTFVPVDVFGNDNALPSEAWTGVNAEGNIVSSKGQNIEYTFSEMGGSLISEKWTNPVTRYQIVAQNDRLYGFGEFDPNNYAPIRDNSPAVITTLPPNHSVDIPISTNPKIIFSEPVFHTNGDTISNNSALELIQFISYIPTSFNATINSLFTEITVIPQQLLNYDTEYTIFLSPVEDSVGFATTNKSFRFKTENQGNQDLEPPIATFNPENGAVQIPLIVHPVITFNEPVKKINGAELTNSELNTVITLKLGTTNVSFNATISSDKKTIILIPNEALQPNAQYTLSVLPLKDAAGNQSVIQSSTFNTIDLLPPVIIFTPINGATNVLQNITVTILSNEALHLPTGEPLSDPHLPVLIGFYDAQNNPVPFTASINDLRTLISVNATQPLSHSTTYRVILQPVADIYGNITTVQEISFTTIYPPQISFNPPTETYNVPLWIQPTITFERSIQHIGGTEITNQTVASLIMLTNENLEPEPFTATINTNKTVITVSPSWLLNESSLYYITILPVEDIYGNSTTQTTAAFITEGPQKLVNFDTASFWQAQPGKELDEIGNHSYTMPTLNVSFQGFNIIRLNHINNPNYVLGTYSLATANNFLNTRVQATIHSGGVSTFRFKVKPTNTLDGIHYVVRYSTNGGSQWDTLPIAINSEFFTSTNWHTYVGNINNGNSNILIEITNIAILSKVIFIDNFEWSSVHDLSILHPITILPVSGGQATISTSPTNSAYFKQAVMVNVSNIENGKAVLQVDAYDTATNPLQVQEVTENSQYVFRMPTGGATVEVTLGLAINTTVVGGTATVTLNKKVAIQGETILVNISNIPNTHRFVGIQVNDINNTPVTFSELIAGQQYSFDMPANGVLVTVTIEEVFDITVLPVLGGTATVQTDKIVAAQNEPVQISVNSVEIGKAISDIQVRTLNNDHVPVDTLITNTLYTFQMPAASITVQLILEDIEYIITALPNPAQGGTITGSGSYTYGQQVVLTATPAIGYEFHNWTDETNNVLSTSPTYIFTMPAQNITLTANFSQITYSITFVARDTQQSSLAGVEITIDGYSPIVTNALGEAVISLPNGTYHFTASKEGFNQISGNFTVENANQTIELTMTGIGQTICLGYFIYPNPVSDWLILERPISTVESVRILNITGKEVLSLSIDSPFSQISTEALSPGFYFIRFSNGGVMKFIKK